MNRIFVTGSGFSGTGCVLDWMREQEAVAVCPVRPFSHLSNNWLARPRVDLLKYLSGMVAAPREERLRLLEEALGTLRTIESINRTPSGRLVQWTKLNTPQRLKVVVNYLLGRGASLSELKNPEIKSLSQTLAALSADVRAFEQAREAFEAGQEVAPEFWVEWLDTKLAALIDEREHVVFDKSVSFGVDGQVEFMLEHFPSTRVMFVIRDPVDQLCEKLLAGYGRDAVRRMAPEALEEALASLAAGVEEQTERARAVAKNRPGTVWVCTFEDFVFEHELTTRRLGDWLGFEPRRSGYRNLDLSISRGNIGIGEAVPAVAAFLEGHPCSVLYESMREAALCGG